MARRVLQEDTPVIIDAHTHLGPMLANHERPACLVDAITAEQFVAVLDGAGIDKAIVFPPLDEGGVFFDPDYSRGNRAVYEAVQKYADRLIGYGRVCPRLMAEAVKEFRKCITEYRMQGLMLHPDWEAFLPTHKPVMWPLAELCAEYRLPITFHAGYYPKCQPILFVPLAEAFPQVPIFLKHMGYHYWRDAIVVARHTDNVYLETAGNTTSGEILEAVKQVGATRVVFGSDLPYIFPEVVLAKIRGLPISQEDKARILGGNVARIHRLG
jgi:predicted TIM-barrel fold metal-dependent hydrolase